MGQDPFNTSEFRKLQKEWYARLKDSGFIDIEHTTPGKQDEALLGFNSFVAKKRYKPEVAEYFRRCRHHLTNYRWRDRVDRQLFQWHTNGLSYRKIVRAFNAKFKDTKSIFYIHKRLTQLIKTMYKQRLWE